MPQFTNATAQLDVHAKAHNNVFDVVAMFGADPTGVADSTSAIQAAINAAAAAGQGTVYFPPTLDAYRTTSALTVTTSNIALQGAGEGVSELHLDHATADAIYANGGGGGISNFVLRDMTISCFASGPSRTAGAGVRIYNTGDFLVENVVINHGWNGLYLDTAFTGIVRRVKVSDGAVSYSGQSTCVTVANCIGLRFEYCQAASAHGASLRGWDLNGGIDTLSMDHCTAQGTTQFAYGLSIRNSIGAAHAARWVRISDCYIEADDTAGFGVDLGACYDVEFSGLYTKGAKYGFHVGSGARYIRVIGGVIQLAQENGVLVDAADGLDFIGTLVSDNGQKTANTYDGILVAPTSNFSFVGVRSGDLLWNGSGGFLHRQRYGINIIAGSTNYYYSGLDLRNNLTGGLNDGGTGKVEGFYKTTPITKPAVTGSRAGNAALASALTQLAALGLITDSSSA